MPPKRSHDFRVRLEKDATPPERRVCNLSAEELEEVRHLLDDLLQQGSVRPNRRSWCAPILSIRKKEGDLRLCGKYGLLNGLNITNSYPMSPLDDIFDHLKKAGYFNKTELPSRNCQV